MLERSCGTWVGACDICGTVEVDTDEAEFLAAVEFLKKAGWRYRPLKDGWEHTCPACAAAAKQSQVFDAFEEE